MTWFGGFQCYYSSRTCGLTCEAWGWGRSTRSCYENWCETTVVRAWSKSKVEVEGREEKTEHEAEAEVKQDEWQKVVKKKRWFGECEPVKTQNIWAAQMCKLNMIFPFAVFLRSFQAISLLLCWKSLSFDSCAWSAVTAVWSEGCVCLAVRVW